MKPIHYGLAAFALLGVAALVFVLRPTATTPPAEPARVFEVRPTSEFLNADASIEYYRDLIRKDPNSVQAHVALAQVYMQQARTTLDEARYVPLAQQALERALALEPGNVHARLLQASLYNKLHQFEKGEALARELLAQYPQNAFAQGVLVDALVELGRYQEAVAASDRLLATRPDLASYARAAYLRELHGDHDGALEALELAAAAGVAGREDRAWTLYHVGELMLKNNDREAASRVFNGLLDERPGYAYALGGLAQVALVEGKYPEAIALFDQAYEAAPSSAFLEGLAEVYATMDDAEREAAMARRVEAGLQEAAGYGENVRMEYADFLADQERDLPRALEMAKAEYERRPGHLHALETYAWTLHKSGRSAEAAPLIRQALRLGTRDALLYFRAAHILEGAGQTAEAREQLQRSLDYHLQAESPSAARQARQWLTGG